MNLHENKVLFLDLIHYASETLKIDEVYVEKDYWITRSLQRMARNAYMEKVVFKGGTSLAKACRLTNRFSEDIDIAVIDSDSFSGNQLKMLYANPYPYIRQEISSFIFNYLININRRDLVEKYRLQSFSLNVLDKRRTIVEKLASLFRFSFTESPQITLSAKIRHFYDLYYLANDAECASYIQSENFKKDFSELLMHDKQEFDTPDGWQEKETTKSPLVTDFPELWNYLKNTYLSELPKLAFVEVPDEKMVAEVFKKIIYHLFPLLKKTEKSNLVVADVI